MNEPAPVQLVLDEMFSPRIAASLRERGHRVIAVVERIDLRSMTDENLHAWVTAAGCWLLTENVKDFRPLYLRTLQSGGPAGGLLFSSSRAFPRSRHNPGPLIEALHAWLTKGPPDPPLAEDWLLNDPH